MILVLDNRDSFTFNIVQAVEALGVATDVRCASDPNLGKLMPEDYTRLIVGPGPGHPVRAVACRQLMERFIGRLPLLGVCLGHQVLGMICGAQVELAPEPRHGKIEPVTHCAEGVFSGVEQPFSTTRYHSLCLARAGWPERLQITATAADGVIMGVCDRLTGAVGLQFHPERSGPVGLGILEHFVNA